MKTLFQRQLLDRGCSDKYVRYIFMVPELLSEAGLKAMEAQNNVDLVPCWKDVWNAKYKLIYPLGDLDRFDRLVRNLHEDECTAVLRNVFFSLMKMKTDSFLRMKNIDFSPETILVNRATLEAKLIYLPLNDQVYRMEENHYETIIRQDVSGWIDTWFPNPSGQLRTMRIQLSDYGIGLSQLSAGAGSHTHGGPGGSTSGKNKNPSSGGKWVIAGGGSGAKNSHQIHKDPELLLIRKGNGAKISVVKSEFVLGRSSQADGVIEGSGRIGRAHCKITKNNGKYFVQDLMSMNGTFLNGLRLASYETKVLNDKDELKLADVSFEIRLRE